MDIYNFMLTVVVFLVLLNIVIGFQGYSARLASSRVVKRRDQAADTRENYPQL